MGRLTDIIAVLGIIGTSYLLVDKCENSGKSEQVKDSYNSLKIECDSLDVIIKSERYGKNLAVRIAKELMIKNDSLEKQILHEGKYKTY